MKLRQILLLIGGTSTILFILIVLASVGFDHQTQSKHPPINFQELRELNETLTNFYKELIKANPIVLDKDLKVEVVNRISNSNSGIPSEVVAPQLRPRIDSPRISQTPKDEVNTNLENANPRPSTPITASSKKAIIFTMDCISSFEEQSKRGGAAGELIIRYALQEAFAHFSVDTRIVRSDAEFNQANLDIYDIILLDPWTWAAKGWVPKRNIVGNEHKLYILDFFGAKSLRGNSLKIPPQRILTAFRTSISNTFLGYYITEHDLPLKKKYQGVIWGKDPKHFVGKEGMLSAVADKVRLISTSSTPIFRHSNISWIGHQSQIKWREILAESKFLIGLGNPLLGPSALDAISVGCLFINPIYDKPVLDNQYQNQHPFALEVAPEHVCSYHLNNERELSDCVESALKSDRPPFVPVELRKSSYLDRVKVIFEI